MKGLVSKGLCFACAATLALSLFSGCSASSAKHVDTKKPVTLQLYMVGDAPKDLNEVSAKINALSQKDLNTKIKFNYTTWTDYATKYSLLLSSGQAVDLLYTATWLNFGQYAKQGAFQDLSEMLPEYAPDLYKHIPQSEWDLVKMDGKIYTIPSTYSEFTNGGIMYREDLREKYNLPVPNSVENTENYMAGIKKNMPSQIISLEAINTSTTTEPFGAFEAVAMRYKGVDGITAFNYGMYYQYNQPEKLIPYWGSADFKTDMRTLKRWADSGYWSKSIMSDQADDSSFANGKIVICMGNMNPAKYISNKQTIASSHPDWKVGFVPYPTVSQVAYSVSPLGNGMAVPVTSKNAARALMFYQKLVLDKTYNQLSEYGIEGKHYKDENGVYKQIGDPDTSGFGYEGMNGWAWRNPDDMLKTDTSSELSGIFGQLREIGSKTKFKNADIQGGFMEDYSGYQSYRAAVQNVIAQYLVPLETGEIGNVDSAVDSFMRAVKQAGLDSVQAQYTTQWEAYCKQHQFQ